MNTSNNPKKTQNVTPDIFSLFSPSPLLYSSKHEVRHLLVCCYSPPKLLRDCTNKGDKVSPELSMVSISAQNKGSLLLPP